MTLTDLVRTAHANSAAKGFWDGQRLPGSDALDRAAVLLTVPEKLCLLHSEVSEALEAYRSGDLLTHGKWRERAALDGPEMRCPKCDNGVRGDCADLACPTCGYLAKPEGLPSELADIAIRLADLCGALGIDLDAEVQAKMAYNATRGRMHGKTC